MLPEKVKKAIEEASKGKQIGYIEGLTDGAELALAALSTPPDGELVEEMKGAIDLDPFSWAGLVNAVAAVAQRHMAALQAENERLLRENNNLRKSYTELKKQGSDLYKFKQYVHKRLDDAGIEKEPNGEHSKSGCRIGDRLDIVLKKKRTRKTS